MDKKGFLMESTLEFLNTGESLCVRFHKSMAGEVKAKIVFGKPRLHDG